MYGVVWRSSSKKELAKYILGTAVGIAMDLKSGGIATAMGILKLGASLVTKFIEGK